MLMITVVYSLNFAVNRLNVNQNVGRVVEWFYLAMFIWYLHDKARRLLQANIVELILILSIFLHNTKCSQIKICLFNSE